MYALRSVALGGAVLALVGCQQAGGPAVSAEEEAAVREAIAQAWADYEQVWEEGDAAASAAWFTEDAINMRPSAQNDEGRAELDRVFGEFLSAVSIEEVGFTTQELDVYRDKAYELGTFLQRVAYEDTVVTQRSRYISVWKRQADGSWKIHRFLFNNLPGM